MQQLKYFSEQTANIIYVFALTAWLTLWKRKNNNIETTFLPSFLRDIFVLYSKKYSKLFYLSMNLKEIRNNESSLDDEIFSNTSRIL